MVTFLFKMARIVLNKHMINCCVYQGLQIGIVGLSKFLIKYIFSLI